MCKIYVGMSHTLQEAARRLWICVATSRHEQFKADLLALDPELRKGMRTPSPRPLHEACVLCCFVYLGALNFRDLAGRTVRIYN
jgi:hypothetical protein